MFTLMHYIICVTISFIAMYTYYFFEVEKPTDTIQLKVFSAAGIFLASLLWYISLPITLVVLMFRELLGLFNRPKALTITTENHSPAIAEGIQKYVQQIDQENKLASHNLILTPNVILNESQEIVKTVEPVVKELPEIEAEVMTIPCASNAVEEVIADIPKETPALLEIESAVQENIIPETVKAIPLVANVVPEVKVIIPAVGVLPVDVAKKI